MTEVPFVEELPRTRELADRVATLELLHEEIKQCLESQVKAIEAIEFEEGRHGRLPVTTVQLVRSCQAHTAVWMAAVVLFSLSFLASLGVISLTK